MIHENHSTRYSQKSYNDACVSTMAKKQPWLLRKTLLAAKEPMFVRIWKTYWITSMQEPTIRFSKMCEHHLAFGGGRIGWWWSWWVAGVEWGPSKHFSISELFGVNLGLVYYYAWVNYSKMCSLWVQTHEEYLDDHPTLQPWFQMVYLTEMLVTI